MSKRVGIVGAGVTPFKDIWREKPYYELAQMATREAVLGYMDEHPGDLKPEITAQISAQLSQSCQMRQIRMWSTIKRP